MTQNNFKVGWVNPRIDLASWEETVKRYLPEKAQGYVLSILINLGVERFGSHSWIWYHGVCSGLHWIHDITESQFRTSHHTEQNTNRIPLYRPLTIVIHKTTRSFFRCPLGSRFLFPELLSNWWSIVQNKNELKFENKKNIDVMKNSGNILVRTSQ